jgi:uncharacterized protein YjiS (DUF1127 family)
MYHSSPDRPVLGLAGLSKALAAAVGRRLRRFSMLAMTWHERRKGLQSLRALTDHQLRDIGLGRGEIVMAAYGLHDPHQASRAQPIAAPANRPVPPAKKADNNDQGPCVGCAA